MPITVSIRSHGWRDRSLDQANWTRKWSTTLAIATNVQCWPQDPYFPFSSLVPHFPEVWKCGKVWQSKDNVTLLPSHEPFVILYLVPHFSEVWKCGKVWQSKDIVALSPSHEPFVILYLVPHFSEVWKCGKVRQSKYNVTLFPSHEPFVILYLVSYLVLIRVPSRSQIHAKSESSIDEDDIFAISPLIVKGTSWNLRDLSSHRQGVFDKKRKKLNSSCSRQKLANSE